MFQIIFLYAIFAAMTFVNSAIMESNPYPLLIATLRALMSGIVIMSYFVIFQFQSLKNFTLTTKEWHYLLGYALLIHTVSMYGFSYAALYASPVIICFLYATAPFITAIIEYFYHAQTLNVKKFIGLLVGLIGLVIILIQSNSMQHTATVYKHSIFADIAILVSMIFFCFGWILFKQLITSTQQNVALVNSISMLIGGTLSLGLTFLTYQQNLWTQTYSPNFLWLVSLFLLSSLATYSLYAKLLKKYSATFMSFSGFLEPAFAMLYGPFLIGYKIQVIDGISFGILLLGLYLFYQEELNDLKQTFEKS